MPYLRCYNKIGTLVEIATDADHVSLPNEVVSIVIENGGEENMHGIQIHYEALSRLLLSQPRKLDKITIRERAILPPANLVFLAATFNKTNCLMLQQCLCHPAEIGCLVAGLTQADGPRELHLNLLLDDIPNHLFLMVLQAISFSPSLEKLDLIANNDMTEDNLAAGLIGAITTNRSLNALILGLRWGHPSQQIMQHVFRAAARTGRVKNLSIWYASVFGPRQSLDHEAFMEALCHQECKIEMLRLMYIDLVREPNSLQMPHDSNATTNNTSLKDISIVSGRLDCSQASAIVRRFSSLRSVELRRNDLQTISMFNDLLVQNQLQSLVLENSQVNEADVKSFLMKLPATRSLRNLHLLGNNFPTSKSCVELLENCITRNTSLERMTKCEVRDCDEDWKEYYKRSFSVPLSLNRAGRRHLQNDAGAELPANLWPLILQRAGKISYYGAFDQWQRPTMTSTRADAVYWLLTERILMS
ncbi:unnamed protein product [Cylindrotheca closterium]|uniref:Uncharacterized protein n=1 Tax=Cylindrotheca closterium TaxID=2856 RepID=A0AAD2G975_9STRA|nr:unnamed protein product [Cylindrotheca closterium]